MTNPHLRASTGVECPRCDQIILAPIAHRHEVRSKCGLPAVVFCLSSFDLEAHLLTHDTNTTKETGNG